MAPIRIDMSKKKKRKTFFIIKPKILERIIVYQCFSGLKLMRYKSAMKNCKNFFKNAEIGVIQFSSNLYFIRF